MPHFTEASQHGSQPHKSANTHLCDASEGPEVLRVAGAARPIIAAVNGEVTSPQLRKDRKIDKRSLQQRAAADTNEVIRECQERLAAARTGPEDARITPEGEEAVLHSISRGETKGSRLPRPLKAEHDRKGVARCLLDEAIVELRVRHRMSTIKIAEELGYSYRHIYERWKRIVKRSTESDLLLSESDKATMRELVFGHLEDTVATAAGKLENHAAYGMVLVNALKLIAGLGGLDIEEGGGRKNIEEMAEKVSKMSPLLAKRLRGVEAKPTMTGGAKLAKTMDEEMG